MSAQLPSRGGTARHLHVARGAMAAEVERRVKGGLKESWDGIEWMPGVVTGLDCGVL
jgi:hypothetical protein